MRTPGLTIGITTFNRRGAVEAMASSLRKVELLERVRLLVMDDRSDEFDAPFLERLLPGAEVIRSASRSGDADRAMHRLFEHFVRHGSGYLFNLDSDLLCAPDLVKRCFQVIRGDRRADSPSLYSFFNAQTHASVGATDAFCRKATVGAAGTLWRHELLADVIANVPVGRSYDWAWSEYLRQRGVPIWVSKGSHVQHVGAHGQNTPDWLRMDYGQAFVGYTPTNLAAFMDALREGVSLLLQEHQRRLDEQRSAIAGLTRLIRNQGMLLQSLEVRLARSVARITGERPRLDIAPIP